MCDFIAVLCCSDKDCACGGVSIEPCVCSSACYAALMAGIGKPYEQRRLDAGIPLWEPAHSQFLSSVIAKTLNET